MGQAGSHTVGAVGPHGGESRRSFGNAGTFQATRLQSSGEEGKEFSPFAITAGKHSTRMASSNAGYRPRATTESGHRPAIRAFRQHTVDDSGKMSKHHDDLSSGASSVGSGQAIIVSGGEKRLPTIFKFPGQGKEVFVSGTFNGWQKLRMNRSAKDFVAIVELAEGNHEYKFLVDGEWVNDPNAPVIENESGFKNNLIKVQKSDFDAYEALDMDSAAVANLTALKRQQHAAMASNNFSQEIPSNTLFENRSGPPILPPHLLQVILNKDTPMSCEPTLLPEPNHVMLNHLYALSIKDGVMVLSSTHRYRRKYVTSLLYKPMGNRKIENT